MRVWSCVHCFIFVLLQGYSQGIEFCEARLPVLYVLLSHRGFFRAHVIVRQPHSNRSHTLLLGITAKRGMCVLICYCWSGYSYCLFSAPWQSRNKLWSVPLCIQCPVHQARNSVVDSFLRGFFIGFFFPSRCFFFLPGKKYDRIIQPMQKCFCYLFSFQPQFVPQCLRICSVLCWGGGEEDALLSGGGCCTGSWEAVDSLRLKGTVQNQPALQS